MLDYQATLAQYITNGKRLSLHITMKGSRSSRTEIMTDDCGLFPTMKPIIVSHVYKIFLLRFACSGERELAEEDNSDEGTTSESSLYSEEDDSGEEGIIDECII